MANYKDDLGRGYPLLRMSFSSDSDDFTTWIQVLDILPVEIKALFIVYADSGLVCPNSTIRPRQLKFSLASGAIAVNSPIPFSEIDLFSFGDNPEILTLETKGETIKDSGIKTL
ncbi:MAG: hypothetical protein ACRDEA_22830 [Microcystaceae cyanobacterium]